MPLRLLVISTYRDTDLTRTHPLTAMLADWRRETGVQRLALHGLDEAAVVGLVTAAAGHELTAPGIALAGALHRETEGSPFCIGEILRHLSESGVIFQEGGAVDVQGRHRRARHPRGDPEGDRPAAEPAPGSGTVRPLPRHGSLPTRSAVPPALLPVATPGRP
jgi:hypothetical protein